MKGGKIRLSTKLSSSEQVYYQLKNEIMFLELLPGQAINEVETSERFNLSRTPVRTAFNSLESEGLVSIRPKYGTFVTLIDIDEISDLMYMREKLELSVVMDIEHISKSQEVKMNVSLLQQQKILSYGYDKFELARNFLAADNEFHLMLFKLTNKEGIWERTFEDNPHYNRLRILANRENKKGMNQILEDHREIVNAIISKDYDMLKGLYNAHIYEGIENIVEIVNKYNSYFK